MLRKTFLVFLVGSVLVGCAGNKKTDPNAVAPGAGGTPDGGPMVETFNPSGSDSNGIDGLHTINFEFDRAAITSNARELLNKNADWIKKNNGSVVQIEGHCDEKGSVEYNFALGERRAKVTKDYLVNLGIDGNRLKIISYGKEKPLDRGDSEASYTKNRRANFVPLPQ